MNARVLLYPLLRESGSYCSRVSALPIKQSSHMRVSCGTDLQSFVDTVPDGKVWVIAVVAAGPRLLVELGSARA